MRLYVMRHGPAEDRAPSGRDFDRPLSSAGRGVVERAARALHQARSQARGAAPLRIIASPYLRARETAELVAAFFNREHSEPHVRHEPEIDDDLGADREVPMGLVRDVHAAGGDAILIGHQPIVEQLVRALVDAGSPSLSAGFRTATIVDLEHADARWHLRQLIDPHALPS